MAIDYTRNCENDEYKKGYMELSATNMQPTAACSKRIGTCLYNNKFVSRLSPRSGLVSLEIVICECRRHVTHLVEA